VKQRRIDNPPDVYQGLFGEQSNLLLDPNRLKTAVCSRRAGKTHSVTRALIKACQKRPNALAGYLTKTRDWAEELVWDPLQRINERQHLYGDFNNAKLRCVLPNRSKIRLAGAKDKAQTEVLRGFGYDLLVIDEAGSIDPVIMRYVTREILPAALGETKGTLLVVGTPNESCSGFFHDIATDAKRGYSVHHWTQRQNIMFPRWAHITDPVEREKAVDDYLEEERRIHGYSETDPEYQREYMGLWAKNEELFIYRITHNNLSLPPDEDLRYILSIDLGWHDMTAFELVGYDSYEQKLYEIHSTQEQHLTFDDIKQITFDYLEEVEVDKIVIDTAGAGKIAQESMAKEVGQRFQIPCVAAQKNRKATNMKLLNSDFRAGRVFLLPDGVCQDQMKALQWEERRLKEREPAPGQFIDNADAFLYAYRESYHWLHEEREEIPEINTPDYANWEAAKMEEEEVAAMTADPEEEWWEKDTHHA
jgi:hypothetical protein